MDWNTFLTPLFFVQLLAASVSLATPLVLAALGEIFAQRSGVLNLGLEGIMLFSGFIGFSVVFQLNNLWAGMLAAIMIGALMGLLYAFLAISLHSNQCVTGLSLMSLGTGMALYFYRMQFKISLEIPRIPTFPKLPIPGLSKIPFIGPVFFNHSIFTYLMFVLVLIAVLIIYRTSFGLRMNAVGESPQTADTLGVSVSFIRYLCVVIGGALAGLAGAYYSLVELGAYSDSMVNGRGFIAAALVIFGRWDPLWTLGGGLLFGGIDALQNRLQVLGSPIPSNFLQMTPYVMTIIVLLVGRLRKPPTALGNPYIRK
ncbi:ABC transporter permease [Enterocloster lavalensis]|uniref:ABC transporter permease n=1 Tax=Enterocloster lavalensis TaxID=460384 RepID=UPI001D076E23|nr:ABC transporter permease [Enterocloster lavalensis]MCB6342570.1 ABC transporter permease [Enterocloster lavalensis]